MKRFPFSDLPPLGRIAKRLLHIQMAVLFLVVGIFFYSYLTARAENPAYAGIYYASMVEYLLAGFVISAGSVCLVDLMEREQSKDQTK
ncbi:MAG: hypothetical protein IKC31_01410 [Clostridia bacterium]|nr:hypothetical protein [Clostridia bacterium]